MDFNRAYYLRLSNLDCCIQKLGSSSGVCGIAYPSQEMLHIILEIMQFILIEITKDFCQGDFAYPLALKYLYASAKQLLSLYFNLHTPLLRASSASIRLSVSWKSTDAYLRRTAASSEGVKADFHCLLD